MNYDPKTRDYVVDYDFFDKTEEVFKNETSKMFLIKKKNLWFFADEYTFV